MAVHAGGAAEYTLAPIDVDGTQMLVLPGTDTRRYVTLEARANSPYMGADALRPGARNTGVMLHLVDQRSEACGEPTCRGDVSWKTMAAEGTPWAFGAVLSTGAATMIEGLAVEVVAHNGDGTYTVRVGVPTDDPASPAVEPAPAATPIGRVPSFTG